MTAQINIVGAGPSGLSAAIWLAQRGVKVTVFEAKQDVGTRFHQDLQGLENWSNAQDVLDEMQQLGLPIDFAKHAATAGIAFDAWGEAYPINTEKPLFYTIVRGDVENSLDRALLNRAISLGADVRFGEKIRSVGDNTILATGPKKADAIACGYHFKTSMKNGFWAIVDDELAPKGYAYVLVLDGIGTIKTCMFRDFKRETELVEKTVARFSQLIDLEMSERSRHGGAGNFFLPVSAMSGLHPTAGEQAGFQDNLWGFGLRYAMRSGVLAARSMLENKAYDTLWHKQVAPSVKASVVNRWLFEKLGNRGYRLALKRVSGGETIAKLRWFYQCHWFDHLLYPFAARRVMHTRTTEACHHADCHCVWCQHCQAHSSTVKGD